MHFKIIIRLFIISLITLLPHSSWSLTNVLGDKITIINNSAIEAKLIDSQTEMNHPATYSNPKSIWPRLKDGFSFESKPSRKAKK